MQTNLETKQARRANLIVAAAALAILVSTNTALAASNNKINVPRNPLVAGSQVTPNVLAAFDDSGSMKYETLFRSASVIEFDPDEDGQFVDDKGNITTGPTPEGYIQYSTVFPTSGVYSTPPVDEYAFTRSPDFNLLYFSPTEDYKPWPGHTNYNITSPVGKEILYVPKEVNDDNDERLNLTQAQLGTFNNYKGKLAPVLKDSRCSDVDETFVSCVFYPATFYLTGSSKSDAKSRAGPHFQSYKTSEIRVISAEAPGHTEDITFYQFRIAPSNFGNSDDYRSAIGNFANWFAYNRTRALVAKNAAVRAFNQFSDLNIAMTTLSGAVNKHPALKPHNLGENRQEINKKILSFPLPASTPIAGALNYLGSRLGQPGVIKYACQKNYIMLFTDGYNSRINPSVGDQDSDGVSNTMGDIAAKYYYGNPFDSLDFPDGRVHTGPKCSESGHDPSLDCNENLHATIFAITLGLNGDKFSTPNQPDPYQLNENNKNKSVEKNVKKNIWPGHDDLFIGNSSKAATNRYQLDDLWHATVNSRGAMLSARRPAQLQAKFEKVLKNIVTEELAGNNLALNRNVASAETLIYQASFQGRRGLLQAYSFTGNTIPDFNVKPSAPGWAVQAGDIQNADARHIFTRVENTNVIFDAGLVNGNAATQLPASYNLNAAKIKYIRGDASNEGSDSDEFRPRDGYVLGDIVNSTPAYVGSVAGYAGYIGQFPSAPSYTQFIKDTRGRTPALYVEANDGMLHAFNADKKSQGGGNELFAYIPEAVLPKIHELTQQSPAHRFYADATPTIADAVIGGQWATVLVAGLRAGGKSIFALDVTSPDPDETGGFSKSDILWEITPEDDKFAELGLTYGQPQIARLHTGRWAAMFGNGYNSAGNKSVLYVVDLSDGSLIEKFVVSDSNASAPRSGANGLSTPYPVDLDGDFVTDYVYAGDLHGNMWRFDLTSSNSGEWSATLLFQTSARPDDDDDPNTAPPARAITSAPIVSRGPPGVDAPQGTMVFFGTGKYLEKSDIKGAALTHTNYLYGIWDAKVGSGSPDQTFTSATVEPNELAHRNLGGGQAADNGKVYGSVKNPGLEIDYAHGKVDTSKGYYRGWRLDLGDKGQRIINQPSFTSRGNLTGTSSAPSVIICEAGGVSYLYRLDPYTGGPTDAPAFDTNGDGLFNAKDKLATTDDESGGNEPEESGKKAVFQKSTSGIAGGIQTLIKSDGSQTTIVNSSQGQTKSGGNPKSASARRVSWREIRRGG